MLKRTNAQYLTDIRAIFRNLCCFILGLTLGNAMQLIILFPVNIKILSDLKMFSFQADALQMIDRNLDTKSTATTIFDISKGLLFIVYSEILDLTFPINSPNLSNRLN